jgi:hypothetical protein
MFAIELTGGWRRGAATPFAYGPSAKPMMTTLHDHPHCLTMSALFTAGNSYIDRFIGNTELPI